MNLAHRSSEVEIMDDLDISGEVVGQTLRELDVINRNLGGNQISLTLFRKLISEKPISSLVDLGCGGADILMDMARIALKAKKEIQFTGIDANKEIIAYAQKNTSDWTNISFQSSNIFDNDFQNQYFDVIHCCLFTHHFSNEELVSLLIVWKKQASSAIIINDLHRHPLAYYSIKWITRFFSKSYMVRNDAAVSVARGFKKSEWLEIFERAGIKNFQIRWKWAFRWQILIKLG